MKQELNNKIELLISEGKLHEAEEKIKKYKEVSPKDRDILFLECIIMLNRGNIAEAQNYIDYGVQKNPTSFEAYYYQACVYQEKGEVIQALKSYMISLFLYNNLHNKSNEEIREDIEQQIGKLTEQLLDDEYFKNKNFDRLYDLDLYLKRQEELWGKIVGAPRMREKLVIGKECWVTNQELRYVGIYRAPYKEFLKKEDMNLIQLQGEFLKFAKKGTEYKVNGEAEEYLLPVASTQENNMHAIAQDENINYIVQEDPQHFNYYRMKKKAYIKSKYCSYYGNPIPLGHNKKRRKLVLSFFVDGLAQEVINGQRFEELMPNTYCFFKKGTICTQTYSCAEWTYPSLASIETGLTTLNHMMFHNVVDGELPRDITTLSEYIKKEGYFTCKMDGDWRSIYSYGYTRGIDQYIYQNQPVGSRAEQEIMNVIEHLEAFKEVDQYLWMCVGDLHDVADNMDLSLAVQNQLALVNREYESKGKTSVKQNYSKKKTNMYEQTMKYMDVLFGLLYHYIETNYADEEILISLFADHGQGYLVPDEQNFLSKERTKVAFMFRGKNVQKIETNEIISTADYLPIMCKLLDIEQKEETIDGQLPKIFGGSAEREYTITESLHPGDVYTAVANTKKYEIYFENSDKTDAEGRFKLKDYKIYGFDRSGEKITDKHLLNKYKNIFIERVAERIIYE